MTADRRDTPPSSGPFHPGLSVLPAWLPRPVKAYLAHTEAGVSIRDLARIKGVHASTVLRQIRRVEQTRDDPLIDSALSDIGDGYLARLRGPQQGRENAPSAKDLVQMTAQSTDITPDLTSPDFERDALRVLRRLCEAGAVLAVAPDMGKAVVVRENGTTTARTAVVDQAMAKTMALQGWIESRGKGRILRYAITQAGRSVLDRLVEKYPEQLRATAPRGMSEAPAGFDHGRYGERSLRDEDTGQMKKVRYNWGESPLSALSRRKDKDGTPFLSDELVAAGERLREDFELAQMGPRVAQNWDRFLTPGSRGSFNPDTPIGNGPDRARARVAAALEDLGPGLGDVVLRCCCYLEGLEAAERRMGWSARSGKIVLRIALMRLRRHYDAQGTAAKMIG